LFSNATCTATPRESLKRWRLFKPSYRELVPDTLLRKKLAYNSAAAVLAVGKAWQKGESYINRAKKNSANLFKSKGH
jgi:ABC-type Fe3+ transport system substrate-binding protein